MPKPQLPSSRSPKNLYKPKPENYKLHTLNPKVFAEGSTTATRSPKRPELRDRRKTRTRSLGKARRLAPCMPAPRAPPTVVVQRRDPKPGFLLARPWASPCLGALAEEAAQPRKRESHVLAASVLGSPSRAGLGPPAGRFMGPRPHGPISGGWPLLPGRFGLSEEGTPRASSWPLASGSFWASSALLLALPGLFWPLLASSWPLLASSWPFLAWILKISKIQGLAETSFSVHKTLRFEQFFTKFWIPGLLGPWPLPGLFRASSGLFLASSWPLLASSWPLPGLFLASSGLFLASSGLLASSWLLLASQPFGFPGFPAAESCRSEGNSGRRKLPK